MTYIRAYLIALGRLLVISGAAFFLFRLAGGPEWTSVFLVYVSITAAVAGPIGVWIEDRSNAK